MNHTPKSQWEYIYQTIPAHQIPWETGQPSPDLLRLFKRKLIRNNMKVLDVGCGLGTQTIYMAKKGAMATGIDVSETAIRKAREQMLRGNIAANFMVGDVCKTALPTGSFEFVYDRGCYHHLSQKQREKFANEVSRILTPGGLFHMLVFAGTLTPIEVIELFLPNFAVEETYEDTVIDHTNSQEITVHIVRFRKA